MTITVRVSELLKMANELNEDGTEFVEISILEEVKELDGEVIPATLHFSAYDDDGSGLEYEAIKEKKFVYRQMFKNGSEIK